MNAQSTPPLIRAISCDMDILAQTNDTLIVSNVWFSKEFPEFSLDIIFSFVIGYQ